MYFFHFLVKKESELCESSSNKFCSDLFISGNKVFLECPLRSRGPCYGTPALSGLKINLGFKKVCACVRVHARVPCACIGDDE